MMLTIIELIKSKNKMLIKTNKKKSTSKNKINTENNN